MAKVRVTYNLSLLGQRANLAAGGNGAARQEAVLRHHPREGGGAAERSVAERSFELAVSLASINKDGNATLRLRGPVKHNLVGGAYDEPLDQDMLLAELLKATEKHEARKAEQARELAEERRKLHRKLQKLRAQAVSAAPSEALRDQAEKHGNETEAVVLDEDVRHAHLDVNKYRVWARRQDELAELARVNPEHDDVLKLLQAPPADPGCFCGAVNSAANDIVQQRRRAAAERAEVRRKSWAQEHGSERLRLCLEEGIECGAVYVTERMKAEIPGWVRERDVPGRSDEPRNPPLAALHALAEARKLAQGLEHLTVEGLVFWQGRPQDGGDQTRYAVEGSFLDQTVLCFVEEEPQD